MNGLVVLLLVASTFGEHFDGHEHNKKHDHEAFLGKDTAREFEQLTPEQSKERLGRLITKIDINRDGFVDEDELRQHLTFMHQRYVSSNVDRVWKYFKEGAIKDDKLDFEGHRSAYSTSDHAKDQRRWNAADYDGDGKLDRKEYGCFMMPNYCEHMGEVVVMEEIDKRDKDHDGLVDFIEYLGDRYQDGNNDWLNAERENFKRWWDKDNDGKLNHTEIRQWIMPVGYDHASGEARHLIHAADDNKDKKLTRDEILSHYDHFVGSRSTDYGEQLKKHDPTEF